MNRPFLIRRALVLVALLAASVWVWLQIRAFGRPVSIVHVTGGHVGPFVIGETRQSLLARVPGQVYVPEPKPASCTGNWIAANTRSDAQRACLLGADRWEAEGGQELCPARTDFSSSLFFADGRLKEVVVRCTPPE